VLLFGLIKAFKYDKNRVNKVILSLHPLILHLCFIIFAFC